MADDVHVAARALQPRQAEPRPSTSPADEGLDILYKLAATSRRLPHQQAAERARRSCRSTSTTSGPTTRTSSTCAAPARASAAPTPTRAPTTRSRSGAAAGRRHGRQARPSTTRAAARPAPGFGDSIGAMTIAGGIMGALFHRERTGEADGRRRLAARHRACGRWARRIALSARCSASRGRSPPPAGCAAQPAGRQLPDQGRPLRSLSTACRPVKYWAPLCECIGRPDLAADPRFADHESLMAHGAEAAEILARGVRRAHRRRVASGARRLRRPVDRRAGHARGRHRRAVGGQRLHAACETSAGVPFEMVAAPGAVRRRAARLRPEHQSSTSTATPSSPISASTGTRSST